MEEFDVALVFGCEVEGFRVLGPEDAVRGAVPLFGWVDVFVGFEFKYHDSAAYCQL